MGAPLLVRTAGRFGTLLLPRSRETRKRRSQSRNACAHRTSPDRTDRLTWRQRGDLRGRTIPRKGQGNVVDAPVATAQWRIALPRRGQHAPFVVCVLAATPLRWCASQWDATAACDSETVARQVSRWRGWQLRWRSAQCPAGAATPGHSRPRLLDRR